jgi:hypothetical protein
MIVFRKKLNAWVVEARDSERQIIIVGNYQTEEEARAADKEYKDKKLAESYALKQKGLEMAANVVHSVDAYVARELIYRASFASEDLLGLLPAIEVALAAANTNNEGKVFSLHTLMNTPKHAWPLLGKSFLQKAWNYLNAMPNRPAFTVITIHDDFKCHPNYLHWVKWLYIEILAEIADSSLIKQIIEEINPKLVYNKVPSTELAKLLRFAYVTNSGKGLN